MTVSAPYASSCLEATHALDRIDRWRIAERFELDRVHDRTRTDLYRAFEQRGGHHTFQGVVQDMLAMGEGEHDEGGIPFINYADFTSDLPAEPDTEDLGTLAPFANTTRWLRDVVSHYCPFVRPSLEKHRIWMTSADRTNSTGENLFQFLQQSRRTFLSLGKTDEEREARFNALVVLFPDFPSNRSPKDVLKSVQSEIGFSGEHNVELGSFVPRDGGSRVSDPSGSAPPAFVFRHEL